MISLYPWEVWLSQPRVVLRRGREYHISQASMCQMTRNWASRLGVQIAVEDRGNRLIISRRGAKVA